MRRIKKEKEKMKLYVHAPSKKALNEAIARGERIFGMNYSLFGDAGEYCLNVCESGTVVAIWSKTDPSGNPIPKSWGTWDREKGKLS
jgi:hypothetical protein